MNTVIIEHVSISELPEDWRAKMGPSSSNRVTVRIEEETSAESNTAQSNHANPLFGIWRDREEMSDVAAYVRQQRTARF